MLLILIYVIIPCAIRYMPHVLRQLCLFRTCHISCCHFSEHHMSFCRFAMCHISFWHFNTCHICLYVISVRAVLVFIILLVFSVPMQGWRGWRGTLKQCSWLQRSPPSSRSLYPSRSAPLLLSSTVAPCYSIRLCHCLLPKTTLSATTKHSCLGGFCNSIGREAGVTDGSVVVLIEWAAIQLPLWANFSRGIHVWFDQCQQFSLHMG